MSEQGKIDVDKMNEQAEKAGQRIERALERISVRSVFGEPIKEGEVTLIPVAEIGTGFGYGYGFGRGPKAEEGEEEEEKGKETLGGGTGGGGGGVAKPRGYIRITSEEVTYEPIEDESRIAMAGIALSAWAIFWVARAISAFAKALARRKECTCAQECTCGEECTCEE